MARTHAFVLGLAAGLMTLGACVDVPTNIKAQFAAATPEENSHYRRTGRMVPAAATLDPPDAGAVAPAVSGTEPAITRETDGGAS